MLRRAVILLALMLHCVAIGAQQDTLRKVFSVQGIVVADDSGRAMEAVMVSIPESDIATATNAEGKFVIKSASEIHTLRFSFMGYAPATVQIQPGHSVKVRLVPVSYALDASTIISGDALEIVRAAIEKIPENYGKEPQLLECFYRETVRKRSRYTYISEAVAKMYKDGYGRGLYGDRTALEKSRVLISPRLVDTLSVKVQGGPAQAMFLDIVKNPDILLNSQELELYRFEMGLPEFIDGRMQFVIHLSPGPAILDRALYYGTLYIDREKLFFTRIELSLDVSNVGKAVRQVVIRKPPTLRLVPKEVTFRVNYRFDGTLARMSYFRSVIKFSCDWKKRLFATNYTAVNELVVTDVRHPATPIPRQEAFRPSDILSDKASKFQDPDFWLDYNIIEPTESLEHAVGHLRKGR